MNMNINNNKIYDTIETFEGIKKNNARTIFSILLIIIVIDFCMEIF